MRPFAFVDKRLFVLISDGVIQSAHLHPAHDEGGYCANISVVRLDWSAHKVQTLSVLNLNYSAIIVLSFWRHFGL